MCVCVRVSIYIYIYIYIYNVFIFSQKKGISLIDNEYKWFFGFYLRPSLSLQIPVHLLMTSQICCKPIKFVIELTQVSRRLLLKDIYKANLRRFALMKSHRSTKSVFEQTYHSTNFTNMFRLLSVRDRG